MYRSVVFTAAATAGCTVVLSHGHALANPLLVQPGFVANGPAATPCPLPTLDCGPPRSTAKVGRR